MDARQTFKFAFISRCIEAGHTQPKDIIAVIKTAMDKQALNAADVPVIGEAADGLAKLVGVPLYYGAAAALAAPPLLGYMGGRLAAGATDASDFDVNEAKQQEVIDEYHRQADRMRNQGALRKFTQTGQSGFKPLI